MSGNRSRIAWTAVLLTAVVSASTLIGPSAQALDGETGSAGENTFTAKIDVGGERACSGTLVNNQWLITAASCFTEDPAQATSLPAGAPKLKSTATIGRANLTSTVGEIREITQLVPRADRDLVLARLASPVYGLSFLHPASAAPTAGESLKGAGYGRTKDTWVPDTLHSAAFTAGAVEATSVTIDGTPVCKGDSGAPVFREKDGRPELAAIVTNSWQGGCLGSDETRTGAMASRVDDIRAWLTENTASTLNNWNLQMLARTSTGLYHAMRNSNGDWTGFGDVQKVAGSIEDVAYAADAAIKGKNYVFAVGGDEHLYEANRRPTGGWEAFRDITDEVGSKPGLTSVAVTSTGSGLALIGLASGRVYHAAQGADEKWSKWGDVSAKLGVLGNATQVTTAQTSGGDTQIGVVADKKAYHATRYSDGTWSAWGHISNLPTGLDAINGMAFAGTGSDLQIILTSPTGDKKHATRADTTGSWSAFGSLGSRLGNEPTISVDAASVTREFQAAVVTADGKIKHILRHDNGKWDAVEQVAGYPGTPAGVALTGSAD
ncbi:trypsin-like serine protease [Streptomyces sp. NBC_00893]|uniref:trypsin-like serine protease n=1 Tax=Streptomyces sp. NBC_00893 TaxID=2975862 RepID=UPI0022556E8E|nr:trypsin-like serine protease [Streptomyces sp. NBC_00893]MCX4852082.1 S1 family peptidase [Streptomyces sp. NBC_00893]